MNRRDFLSTGFKLGAAGLLLPVIEPVRRVWALDRTMAPSRPSYSLIPTLNNSSYYSFGPLPGDVFVTTYDANHKLNVWDGNGWVIVRMQDDIDRAIERTAMR